MTTIDTLPLDRDAADTALLLNAIYAEMDRQQLAATPQNMHRVLKHLGLPLFYQKLRNLTYQTWQQNFWRNC